MMGRAALEPASLYLTDEEIAPLVMGKRRAKEWSGVVTVLERRGFPPKDPLFGGRYWPSCREFLDRHNGLTTGHAGSFTDDGGEEWNDDRRSK